MDNATGQGNNTALIGIGKHLKVIVEQQTVIAEQQKQQGVFEINGLYMVYSVN